MNEGINFEKYGSSVPVGNPVRLVIQPNSPKVLLGTVLGTWLVLSMFWLNGAL